MSIPNPVPTQPTMDQLQRRNARLQATYGITLDEYNQMLEAQYGVCAVCLKPHHPERPLVVDHNHDTGEVRGLLCSECNTGLGLLQDNPLILQSGIGYLVVHGHYDAATGQTTPGTEKAPPVVQEHLDLEQAKEPTPEQLRATPLGDVPPIDPGPPPV